MLRVFYTFLGVHDQVLLARQQAFDPPAYRERIDRMKDDGARSRTRAGLWLLKKLLAAADYADDTLERIGFSASGQPQIHDAPAFSISHSEQLVACALCDEASIGLDVEHRRLRDMARMARLLDPAERAHVERQPLAFFDYWCAREATVKASGRVGLKRIRALSLAGDTARLDERDWHLRALDLDAGYAACLASDRPIGPVDLRELSLPGRENTGPHRSSDQ
ncbi:4'-phosphopantetheinyl transferase superfamily protein [Salinisphaera sp.]|uniref:4'-phosphopantetheinyl transferase family protein n=1 Tax=Salinisphaera sp. TaxID=1914330 RepID=UPI0025E75FDC|nr:4'-phosphopantetheinyl transferase superfamily protein [Salinisphaera sp.]